MVRVINPKILNILADPAETNVETTIAVASTGTAYSRHFLMPKGVSFAWEFLFSSDAAVDVKIELEQSDVEPAVPATPASDGNYVVPDGKTLSTQVNDEVYHRIAYSPVVSGYGRLKLTGQGSNAASTILTKAKMIYIKNA